jgi:PAS domain S-box-containing protein
MTVKTKAKATPRLTAADDRLKVLAAFRASEIRYRRLFETAHDGVLLLDPATRKIVDANPFMTKLLGYTRRQLIGKELFEIGLLKDEVASQEMFLKLKRKHEVRYEDLPLESRRGQHQEVEVVANLYSEDGHHIIQCNIRDITARKKIEQELAEKARLLDLSHDAIIVRDIAGRIRYWNRGAEELYGWSRKEALGKPTLSLLQTRFLIPLKTMLKELYLTDRWVGELSHVKRNGQRITLLARKTLDRDRYGRPTAVLETLTDITERKAAFEAQTRIKVLAATNQELVLEIAQRKAVEAALRKSEHHYGKLLAESERLQEQLRHLSRQILLAQEDERKRISRELHDVIAQTLTGINVRLAALKKEAVTNTRHLARDIARTQRLVEKSVNIVHEFARELRPAVLDDLGLIPALHSFVKLFSKRTHIHVEMKAFAGVEQLDIAKRTVFYRVAQEALTNVSRHAKASRVEIHLQKLTHGIGMKIKDNGKSFSVEQRLQAKGNKRLGLLGMRERVEMVGGTFGVESTLGKGTTIEVEIPFAPPPRKTR